MTENITISKQNYNLLCVAIAILLIALLILWFSPKDKQTPSVEVGSNSKGQLIKDGVKAPISEEFKSFLNENNYKSLILLKDDARIKMVDVYGKDIEVCAITKEGKIHNIKGQRDCAINNTNILNMHSVAFIDRETNPRGPCMWVGGKLLCNY